jgi:hypothetical protein
VTAAVPAKTIGTGTPEFAAALLTDLYVRLRRDLQRWATVTKQTSQARMGYIGQHLVSVVTTYPGGRSGARGDDIKLPDGRVAEIKTCALVDQLGYCREKGCGARVSSVESACSTCGSTNIKRQDDSKWLLNPKNEKELREAILPASYYLVLFEFADIAKADDIDVQVYEVDPRCLGFVLCIIDWFFNIRAHSKSKAAFNLFPHDPKFLMMKPRMIYWSVIKADDAIDTKVFPKRDAPVLYALGDLVNYSAAGTFSEAAIDAVATARGLVFPRAGLPATSSQRRRKKLELLQQERIRQKWPDDALADDFARAVYRDRIADHQDWTDEFAPTL